MKKLAILFVSLLSCTLLTAQSNWTLMQLPVPEELNSVAEAPGLAICIGGEYGDIRRADTSLSFTSTLPMNNEGVAEIIFTSWGDGWAVAEDGLIFKSTDGGLSWTQQLSGTSSSLESISFVNQDTAYIAGRDGVILRSTDGGTSWSMLTSGTTERLEAVSFATTTHGFVAGRNGILLETTDAGNNWSNVSVGTDDNKEVLFVSSTIGFVAGGNGVKRTTDAGATWTTVLSEGIAELEALAFRGNDGLGVGEDGKIYRTTDQGLTWLADTVFMAMLGFEFTDVAFIDTIGAIAVGEGGYIAHQFTQGGNNGGVSVNEADRIEVRTYPNPVKNIVHLDYPSGLNLSKALVLDRNGQVVREMQVHGKSLDLSRLPNGIYMLVLQGENNEFSSTSKILVSH